MMMMMMMIGRMSDQTRLAESDELQNESASAERRRSLGDVTDTGGLAVRPPRHVFASYDRQAAEPVEQREEMPPPYSDCRTGEVSRQQQQQQQLGWQQSAGCGDYPRHINTAYNQFQQQAARPTSTVVRLQPADDRLLPTVPNYSWKSWLRLIAGVIAVKLAILIPVIWVILILKTRDH